MESKANQFAQFINREVTTALNAGLSPAEIVGALECAKLALFFTNCPKT